MTDSELLKLAARAAPWIADGDVLYDMERGSVWNPLKDDGDALRLAVVLNMEVYHADDGGMACYASWPTARGFSYAIERHGVDAVAATRRAIVRAAAAIGEAMP